MKLNTVLSVSIMEGGGDEAPLGDNSIDLEGVGRPWGHSDSLRGKILFPTEKTQFGQFGKICKRRH